MSKVWAVGNSAQLLYISNTNEINTYNMSLYEIKKQI